MSAYGGNRSVSTRSRLRASYGPEVTRATASFNPTSKRPRPRWMRHLNPDDGVCQCLGQIAHTRAHESGSKAPSRACVAAAADTQYGAPLHIGAATQQRS